MPSNVAAVRRQFVRTAIGLVLGLSLLGLPRAGATTAFMAYGLLTDGATFIGNVTIDTVTGAPTTVDITVSSPDSLHATTIQASYSVGTSGWAVAVGATGNSTPSLLLVIPADNLIGYTGGPLSTISNLGGGANALLGGLLAINTAPYVTTNPVGQTVCGGQTVAFSAAASGNPLPSVQWQISGDGIVFNDIPLATSPTLTLFNVSASQNGSQYRAAFSGAGTAYSTPATLTVTPLPVVTTNPVNQAISDMGDVNTVTFIAAANPSTGVQWQVSADGGGTFNNISGQTSGTLTVAIGDQQDGRQYRAVFTNACGSSTTSAATLSVIPMSLLFRFLMN